ncbi:hypothetical protein AA0472_2142 [Acetobacter estunensis NRIC 0472]|uniref:Uncharacterized protein n=1 Tax=Acetobacter estunensis TaxID=104097 RepID=A0A967B8D3_9PROT|nr:hypothetical protein [Acetobacter estunensis]NHO55019.1 hypothetical protein [Acetobacter estunensis]GBQ26533.1 hypothetical protein AA0472_2142 [Acetobacter estunensis NRIC 0472]
MFQPRFYATSPGLKETRKPRWEDIHAFARRLATVNGATTWRIAPTPTRVVEADDERPILRVSIGRNTSDGAMDVYGWAEVYNGR